MSCRHCRSRVVWNGKSPRWRATTESTGKIVSRLLTNGCIIEAEYSHHQPERGTLCTRRTNLDHAGLISQIYSFSLPMRSSFTTGTTDLLTARHLKPVGCTPSRRTSP